MRLFEAIMDANHRAHAGDPKAGLRPAEFTDALPVVALTCIDPRLNPLIPEVLGVPEEQFIWLRNAGNILTGPLSSTMRSLALACAVKGGKEIVIIGHSDCQVCKTSMMTLLERFRALGVDRSKLPENLQEHFGLFASERQNVLKAVEFVRHSSLISPRMPVHGLMVDIESGRLEWIVNGYQTLETATSAAAAMSVPPIPQIGNSPATTATVPPLPPIARDEAFADFKMGEMKFPETKIGGGNADMQQWMTEVETIIHGQKPPVEAQVGVPPPLHEEPPPAKRKYAPRPPTIPLPQRDDEGKLIQPWKKNRP